MSSISFKLGLTLFKQLVLVLIMVIAAVFHKPVMYIIHQGCGQANILFAAQSIDSYMAEKTLSVQELKNLEVVSHIKSFCTDSLGFRNNHNFEKVYNQHNQSVLWVLNGCKGFAFEPYYWSFPLVGNVSYKGFFKYEKALKEAKLLSDEGYDTDIGPVSAWSTLGWFNDPLLSNNLKKEHGKFCNLLFHELFHMNRFRSGQMNENENLAVFIADKATRWYLEKDTTELRSYIRAENDHTLYSRYILRKKSELESMYKMVQLKPDKNTLKTKKLKEIADSIPLLPLLNMIKYKTQGAQIIASKNAYFVGFVQYESMQDSLEKVFNIIYSARLKKMLGDLIEH